jgi:5-methyltetrahydropteroyltriglutamate--homocysteine methyltransferase
VLARRGLPGSMLFLPGVIDTTTNYVEHPEEIAERLKRVASVVGDPKRVIAGTDCGFDTSAGAGKVAEEIVWAKLASLAEGARIASRRKAAFRVFDSTSVSESDGRISFNGSAGDPPPEPRSNQVPGRSGTSSAARSGSMNSLSNVESVGGCKGRAVRLILTFHFASRR